MTNDQQILAPEQQQPGALQKTESTMAVAIAAQAEAAIRARFGLAQLRPRVPEQSLIDLKRECARPTFAQQARYHLPIAGQDISGPTIRFVEAAMAAWGNVFTQSPVVHDDERQRVIQVSVIDLERNVSQDAQIVVTKTVERKFLKKGQKPLGQRTNSYGQTVFTVEATDREVTMKQQSEVSKAMRKLGERILPGWFVEEAMAAADKTAAQADAQDPRAATRRLVEAFQRFGVQPADLTEYLGHALESVAPDELDQLRGLFEALRDGETDWRTVMAERTGKAREEAAPKAAASQMRDKVKQARNKKPKPKPEPGPKEGASEDLPVEAVAAYEKQSGKVRPEWDEDDVDKAWLLHDEMTS